MAGEGGYRPWWRFRQRVNVSNGNFLLVFAQGSCVTCGGASQSAYPDPREKRVLGPVLVYNGLGTPDTDLGPKWMLPYHAKFTVDPSGNATLIDADGTQRYFAKGPVSNPQTYDANTEPDVLTSDGTDFTLTRMNGDKWIFGMSDGNLKRIESRTGDTITVTWASGRIDKITDSEGRDTFCYYSTIGGNVRLSEIRELAPGDVGIQSTFLMYDASGRLIMITNPMGEQTVFSLDTSDRIATMYDGHAEPTVITYSSNKVSNIEDPNGDSTGFAYTSTTTTVTDRLSKTTVFTIDSSGRVTKQTDAIANEQEFAFDSTTWELTSMLGPKIPVSGTPWSRHKSILTYGTTTATQHDLLKLEVKKITDTDSTGTLLAKDEWTYNTFQDELTHKDANDKIWTTTYQLDSGGTNSVGLVKTRKNPLNETYEDNAYDSAHNYRQTSSTDGAGKTTSFAYSQNTSNSYGIPDKITTPLGRVTNLKIDIRGRPYEITPPTGNTTKIEYDALDRKTREINPDGTAKAWIFDCCHLVGTVDENLLATWYERDKLGNMVKEIDPMGWETSRTYNAESWLLTITDPRGKTTTNTFDDIGRITQIDYPGGWQEFFTYWEPGMLKSKKSKKGTPETTVNYEYDDLYILKKRDFPSGTDTEYENDALGQRTKMKDASGEKRYTRDDARRLTKVVQGPTGFTEGTNENYKLDYAWNAASQCTQKKLTIRTQSAKTWDLAYTDDSQLYTVTNPDSEVSTHQWLDDGRLKKIVLTTGSTRELFYQDTNDSHAYVSAKNSHLRKTLDKKSGGTVICSFEYELDPAGNRLSMKDKDAKYTFYGLDPNYQLHSETKLASKSNTATRELQYVYGYDGNGNRTTQHKDGALTSYTIGDNNELTAIGTTNLTYDHFGNTLTNGLFSYTWDFEGHMLTGVRSGLPTSTDTHEYDGDGRRMRSKWNNASDWTNFVYDEIEGSHPAILAEYTLISGTFTIKSLNTHGIGLINTNREGTKRYFHFDGLGSTWALTDGSEVVQDTYTWSAFGVQEASTGSSTIPFRYVGQFGYYDDTARGSTLGLRCLGVRQYSPSLGRFLSWDPLREPNRYDYVRNAPLDYSDPSGRRRQGQKTPPWDRPKPPGGPGGFNGRYPPNEDLDLCIAGCIGIWVACVQFCRRLCLRYWWNPKECALCFIGCGVLVAACLLYCKIRESIEPGENAQLIV